jgi:rhodanese-related sulfurtransferase
MRLSRSFIFLLACTLFLSTSCQQAARRQDSSAANASAGAAATPADGIRRVTVEELRAALAEDRAVVLDVRGSVEYEMGHIKGALLMPLGQIQARASELPREKLLVTYCACKHEGLSGNAVQELKQQGIENAGALLGGLDAWKAAGLPTSAGENQQ